MVHATGGLADVLLSFARDREPEAVSVSLSVTPARDLDGADGVDPDVPVFTHFYMPGAAGSVAAVYGVDLGTPTARTQGRFVSHPDGRLDLLTTDDLHGVVFVAVPPWDRDSLAAFDRGGTRLPLSILDAEPPAESIE